MARPKKQGADYFPLDVYTDDKLKIIQIKFGLEGFAIVIKMYQKVYSNGYWYPWGEDEALIFADENKLEYKQLQMVIDECLARNIFDNNLYCKYSILTSNGIQKRYNEIIKRRKDNVFVEDYIMNNELMSTLCKDNEAETKQDDDNNSQTETETEIETESKHETETESKKKEKKSKSYSCTLEEANAMTNDDVDEILNTYSSATVKCAEFVTMKLNEIQKLNEDHGKSFTLECIDTLDNYKGANGKKYKSDYRAILNWVIQSVKERQAKEKKSNNQTSKNGSNGNYGKTKFVNFQQRQGVDYSEIERLEQERHIAEIS